jgi:hypothetical protein
VFKDKEKPAEIRSSNIVAAKGGQEPGVSPGHRRLITWFRTLRGIMQLAAVADAVRTSLGPRGMDKMVGARKTLAF